MDCPLCRLCNGEIITRLYYQDDKVIVVDCSTHGVPICVLRRHIGKPTKEEEQHMRKVMKKLFGDIHLRPPRSILDHFHLHT